MLDAGGQKKSRMVGFIKFVLIKSRAWGGGEIGQRQSKHYKLPIIR